MKVLYEKKKKLAEELRMLGMQLDEKLEKRFGFSYSETDDNEIIDTLDYGTNRLEYSDFIKKMNQYKKQRDKNS